MSSVRSSTRPISAAIWPGRQKMCASSCAVRQQSLDCQGERAAHVRKGSNLKA